MKPILTLLIALLASPAVFGQQFISNNVFNKTDKTLFERETIEVDGELIEQDKEVKKTVDRFGIYGYGNLNEENEKKLNGSTKLSCYFIPYYKGNFQTTVNLSFNKNATNDTLLASTLVFPESGNNAFIGTLDARWLTASTENTSHLFGLFGEFSLKNVKAKMNDTAFSFDILNYVLGARYTFDYAFTIKQKDKEVERHASFSIIPYLHFSNIPNEDNDDYRKTFNTDAQNPLPSSLFSLGVKVMAQYHQFGIFADFKGMTGNEKIDNRDIKGFNSNIGVVVSAELLQF